jgi:intracellular sulfur oxidation DsrE/DsrF family protein
LNNLIHNKLFILIACLSLVLVSACDKQEQSAEKPNMASITANTTEPPVQNYERNTNKVIIENKNYLFNVKGHSLSEIEALLERTEQVTTTQSSEYQDLEIVMVIHGPDIEWFTQQSHVDNQKLLDLAARLDARDIVDMKVCETTMEHHGVERKDIPRFIDTVPYAPTEIENRLRDGYINL